MQTFKIIIFCFILSLVGVSAQAEKKLLPKQLSKSGHSLTYAYDKENRIISITESGEDRATMELIEYLPNNSGYITTKKRYDSLADFKSDNAFSSNSDTIVYTESSKSKIMLESESQVCIFTFTGSGKVKRMEARPSNYDEKTAIDPPVIIGYKYDKHDNIVGADLPNNASGDRVNRSIQMLNYVDFKHDNKNGIFKHVSPASFMKIFDMASMMPCYYFIGNNLLKMTYKASKNDDEDNDEEDNVIMSFSFDYNKDGYPSLLKSTDGSPSLSITYVEAH